MSEAGVLHCPSCGAVAGPNDTICGYCQAPLATVACPKCFGIAFKGAKNCPHCGAQLVETAAVREGQGCPGCKRPMALKELGGYSLEICEGCASVWIDRSTFETFCHDQEKQVVVVQALPSAPSEGTSALHQGYRPCPECRQLMNRVNFAQISGVILDACRDHGTFFDPDELRRLVAFLQAGGMERARSRQVEALKAEEGRLREANRELASGPPAGGEWSGGSVIGQTLGGTFANTLEQGLTRFLFNLFLR